MAKTWFVVEGDDPTTIQRQFVKGEILDQFPHKGRVVCLMQGTTVPPLPETVQTGPIYGVGIFRDEKQARTLAKSLSQI